MKLINNRKVIKVTLLCLLCWVAFSTAMTCYAEENPEEEYSKLLDEIFTDDTVNDAIEEVFGENRLSIREVISELLRGEGTVIDILGRLIKNRFMGVEGYKTLLIKLFSLTLICALFGFLPQIFGNEQTSQMGHFISFIILIAFMLSLFDDAVTIVGDTIEIIIFLMNAIIPAYLISMALSGAITTAGMSYEMFMVIIYIIENIIMNFVSPAVLIYLVIGFANQLLESDKFSKLTELIKKAVSWSLKGFLTLMIGFQLLQGLITPYVDKFNTSVAKKTIEAIPGVGDITSSGVEIAVGAALLIKNTIGVVGMIILIAAAAVPLLELLGYAIILILVNTMLQPVLQVRVQKILDVAVSAVKLLVQLLLTVLLLFFISMALIAAKSGGGL